MALPARNAKALLGLGVTYGPLAYEAVRAGRQPTQDAVRRALDRRFAQRVAADHARTVLDGAVLRVVHRGAVHWVVYSGQTPVEVYPRTPEPVEDVVRHRDVAQRVPVADLPAARPRRLGR